VQLIGQMPPVLPGVSDEYGATGPGLTGGLQGQLQGGGFGGNAAGGPSAGAGAGAGRGFGGDRAPGGFGSMSGQGSTFGGAAGGSAGSGRTSILGGGSSAAGSGFGGGGAPQGGAGFGSGGAAGGRQQSDAGSAFGSQTSLFDRGSSLSPGGTAAEPLLGPDGQPVKLMFLRRLPVDPFTGKAEWGMRCYGEPPTDSLWCGRDVFDVYSKSIAAAIDGSKYKDW
jgi:hypothetical protein